MRRPKVPKMPKPPAPVFAPPPPPEPTPARTATEATGFSPAIMPTFSPTGTQTLISSMRRRPDARGAQRTLIGG